ncbi:MAG: class I SAM-dependent methyltransferase [Candidatus Cloacimonadia bacterium]
MKEWENHINDSKERWEKNAGFWDDYMGDDSNSFHREIVKPDTEKLLSIKKDDLVLDTACGNGNFSKRLAELGASVVAFDYSSKMIKRAKRRCDEYKDRISFSVLDATGYRGIYTRHTVHIPKLVGYPQYCGYTGVMCNCGQ